MFGFEDAVAHQRATDAAVKRAREEQERVEYEYSMRRGPMVEADIDWRVPAPVRRMTEADL